MLAGSVPARQLATDAGRRSVPRGCGGWEHFKADMIYWDAGSLVPSLQCGASYWAGSGTGFQRTHQPAKETTEERLKLPQEGQERFLFLFESPTSSVAQVPQAGWRIFKCQLTQVSSRMREKVKEKEMPGVHVLGGRREAGSWPLTHVTRISTYMGMCVRQPGSHVQAAALLLWGKQNLAHRKQVLIIQLSLAGVLGINHNSPRWIKTEMGKLTFSTCTPHHLFPTPVGFSHTAWSFPWCCSVSWC